MPTTLPAAEAWHLACGAGSPALGGTPVVVGQPADLLLVDTDVVEMTPTELLDGLVYAATGSVVDSTVIAGEVVMRHRHVDGEEETRAQARAHAARLRTFDD